MVCSSFDESTPFAHLQFDVHCDPQILFSRAAQPVTFPPILMLRFLFHQLQNFTLFLVQLVLLSVVLKFLGVLWIEGSPVALSVGHHY